MKKTYLKPTMMVVPVQTTQMICVSIESNVGLKYGGKTDDYFNETNDNFDENDIR